MQTDPYERLRPSGPPNPARFPDRRPRRFRRLRRWYRRTPTTELVMTLVTVGIVLLALGAGLVLLVVKLVS